MSTAHALLMDLLGSLATVYPARVSDTANRPGRVTCVVEPTQCLFDMGAQCAPWPFQLDVSVKILAASSDEQGVRDLLTHVDPVVGLIRAGGFMVQDWGEGTTTNDLPQIVVTASAMGASE